MAIPVLNDLKFNDETKLILGTDSDANIYTATAGHLYIDQTTDDKWIILRSDDGSGGLANYFACAGNETRMYAYYDMLFPNNNAKIRMGASQTLELHMDGTDGRLDNSSGDLILENTADDKDIILKSDDGSGGTTAYITLDGSLGRLILTSPEYTVISCGTDTDGSDYVGIEQASEWVLKTYNSGFGDVGVSLYHFGNEKLKTVSTGIEVTGDAVVTGDVKVTGSIIRGSITTATDSSNTHTCTLADNDNFNIAVANAATTIALTVVSADIGKSGMITITNPASVGSLSFVALPSYMLTPSGATVNFVTTANAVSVISYYVLATDKVLCNYIGNFA